MLCNIYSIYICVCVYYSSFYSTVAWLIPGLHYFSAAVWRRWQVREYRSSGNFAAEIVGAPFDISLDRDNVRIYINDIMPDGNKEYELLLVISHPSLRAYRVLKMRQSCCEIINPDFPLENLLSIYIYCSFMTQQVEETLLSATTMIQ